MIKSIGFVGGVIKTSAFDDKINWMHWRGHQIMFLITKSIGFIEGVIKNHAFDNDIHWTHWRGHQKLCF